MFIWVVLESLLIYLVRYNSCVPESDMNQMVMNQMEKTTTKHNSFFSHKVYVYLCQVNNLVKIYQKELN